MIRHLEAGHFKGVADVRLRINFVEELAARAGTAAGVTIGASTQTLLGELQSGLEAALGGLDLDPAQQEAVTAALETFQSTAQNAVDDYAAGAGSDFEALAGAIRSAFDELVNQIRSTLDAQPDNSVPVAAVPDAASAEPQPDSEPSDPPVDPLASLDAVFSDAWSAFGDSVTAAQQLPDPVPPSGHGAAYAKFLAMYNELRGADAVDTTA